MSHVGKTLDQVTDQVRKAVMNDLVDLMKVQVRLNIFVFENLLHRRNQLPKPSRRYTMVMATFCFEDEDNVAPTQRRTWHEILTPIWLSLREDGFR